MMKAVQRGVLILSAMMILGASASVTSARTYEVNQYVNKDRCFRAEKVPALIEVNTRGTLVSPENRSWQGNPQRHGSIVRDKHNDAVFIQERRVLEEQHVTLVPVDC